MIKNEQTKTLLCDYAQIRWFVRRPGSEITHNLESKYGCLKAEVKAWLVATTGVPLEKLEVLIHSQNSD